MRSIEQSPAPGPRHHLCQSLLRRLRKNEDGTTAIEFAIVAVPFFMFIFGLMGVSSYFFIMTSVEKGMDQASRQIRTGQAQLANKTVKDFKKEICDKAGDWVKCKNVQVFVQKFPDWDQVVPQPCISNNTTVVNSAGGDDLIADYAGAANDIVLVTTCYKWDFAARIPFMDVGQMNDGALMMQTATAFRTEPYSSAPPAQ